jgi:hypothetical protein
MAFFDEPWAESVGVTSTGMDSIVSTIHIAPRTKDEILAVYEPITESN